jgi:hypothetical protein
MAKDYTNLFRSKALQTLPKVFFLGGGGVKIYHLATLKWTCVYIEVDGQKKLSTFFTLSCIQFVKFKGRPGANVKITISGTLYQCSAKNYVIITSAPRE